MYSTKTIITEIEEFLYVNWYIPKDVNLGFILHSEDYKSCINTICAVKEVVSHNVVCKQLIEKLEKIAFEHEHKGNNQYAYAISMIVAVIYEYDANRYIKKVFDDEHKDNIRRMKFY